eukprot:c7202_g1_i1.p1 GENE.c7202_g1_i1~~c7202_g1_i1.p1  ORF type:complete len:349 (-),score=98.12 c7202_g1_i1:30-1076(-)
MPLVQVAKSDITQLRNFLKTSTNSSENVLIEISLPDKNHFETLFNSIAYILITRSFLPLLLLLTAGLSFFSLYKILDKKKNTISNTKAVVFGVEGVFLLINAFFLAVDGFFASDIIPFQWRGFFLTEFFGIASFSTLLITLFYKSMNRANSRLTEIIDIFSSHRVIIYAAFFFLFGLDLFVGLFVYFLGYSVIMTSTVFGCFILIGIIVGSFMAREKILFYQYVKAKAKKWISTQTKGGIEAISKHTGRWSIGNSVFMLISFIMFILISQTHLLTPSTYFAFVVIQTFARWGIGFTNVMVLKWRYDNKTHAKSFSVTIDQLLRGKSRAAYVPIRPAYVPIRPMTAIPQ